MSLCPNCGKEVEEAGNLCAACMTAVVEEAANPAATGASPRWTNLRQRALAGARRGALHGALYGGLYGAIGAMLIYAFAEGDRALTAVYLIVSWGVVGALVLAPLGALLYILFPDKPKKKPAAAADAAVEKDTKIDHP
jgi:integral membrane sensor domain MASE1